MELDKFHVADFRAGAMGDGHSVAGCGARVVVFW